MTTLLPMRAGVFSTAMVVSLLRGENMPLPALYATEPPGFNGGDGDGSLRLTNLG